MIKKTFSLTEQNLAITSGHIQWKIYPTRRLISYEKCIESATGSLPQGSK
jgi:hypothetical protein